LQRCLDQCTELKNIDGQARAHLSLACLLHYMDDSEQAVSHAHRACELFGLPGQQRAGLAASLHTAGWLEARLGNAEQGLAYCQQGLALAQELDNRVIAAAAWDSLGYVRDLLGQRETAVSCYQQAAAVYAEFGAFWYRAEVLMNLGDTHEAAGDQQAARELWEEALEVFEQLHHPDAERLRARLQGSGHEGIQDCGRSIG
jgi:tetratricopeptide (TPR) repeat protein